MDVKYRFPFRRPVAVEDSWPLSGYGAIVEFERQGDDLTALLVTFRHQPIEHGPRVTKLTRGPVKLSIDVGGPTESVAFQIARRFGDYINLYVSIEIDFDQLSVEYIPVDDIEKSKLEIYSFSTGGERPKTHLPFSLLAQAFFAGEGTADPSFAAHMAKAAREAFIAKQFIDAFRYSFLLIEAYYGDGKFKTAHLVKALAANREFGEKLEAALLAFSIDPLHQRSKSLPLLAQFKTAEAVVEHLVSQRGFYFHGNRAHRAAWHPNQQEAAEGLADFSTHLACTVAQSFGGAMFAPEIGKRHFDNAQSQGAIMTIAVQIEVLDRNGIRRTERININVPGTRPTNAMAIEVAQNFLHTAATEIQGTLLSATARMQGTDFELFRIQLAPTPPSLTS